jgi:hypothetical protein
MTLGKDSDQDRRNRRRALAQITTILTAHQQPASAASTVPDLEGRLLASSACPTTPTPAIGMSAHRIHATEIGNQQVAPGSLTSSSLSQFDGYVIGTYRFRYTASVRLATDRLADAMAVSIQYHASKKGTSFLTRWPRLSDHGLFKGVGSCEHPNNFLLATEPWASLHRNHGAQLVQARRE